MFRFALLLAIIYCLVSLGLAWATDQGQGTITGQVVNGTNEGVGVPDQEVVLTTYLNDIEVSKATTVTDAQGSFEFGGLATESSYSYQVSVRYQEADYSSDWLSFGEGENTESVEMTVYEATTSDEAIGIDLAHIIVYVEEDSLWVSEYLLFANEGDKTYIGWKQVAPDGKKETLRFSLPSGATELGYSLELMSCCVVEGEGGFVDTMAFEPGTKEVVFDYSLELSSPQYLFSKAVDYPIERFDLLIQGEGVEATSDLLFPQGVVTIEGMEFLHLSGGGLRPGSSVSVALSGLPVGEGQSLFKWTALGFMALALGFSLAYPIVRRRAHRAIPQASPEEARERLLREMADLDDEFEAGTIPQDEYQRQRSEKKVRLLALMSQGR